jgi:hypothetical protein
VSVTVVSTALSPTLVQRCVESVLAQSVKCAHVLRFAPKSCAENLYEAIHELPPDEIVIWLDGDDELAHDLVAERIQQDYDDQPGLWLTYGQFAWPDGRLGFAREARLEELFYPRKFPWIFTHLKTFRAGLFQKILDHDLAYWSPSQREAIDQAKKAPICWPSDKWLPQAVDQAIMFPMIEMAGPEHVQFIPDVLCKYSGAHYLGAASPDGEQDCERYIRSQQPYKPLKERPW